MYVSQRCSNCDGTGKVYVGTPTPGESWAFMNCLNCHGTGSISTYVPNLPAPGRTENAKKAGIVDAGALRAEPRIDPRTPEEKRRDSEDALADLLGMALAAFVAIPILMQGVVVWWLPVVGGAVLGIILSKLLRGAARSITRVMVSILNGTIRVAYCLVGMAIVVVICLFLFRILQNLM